MVRITAAYHHPQSAQDTPSVAAIKTISCMLLLCCILHSIAEEVRTPSDRDASYAYTKFGEVARPVFGALIELCCALVVCVTGAVMILQLSTLPKPAVEGPLEIREDWKGFVEGLKEDERRHSTAALA